MADQPRSQQGLFADLLVLEKQKAESDALFLSIGDGAIVIDAQGNISRCNQAALDILGYELPDLLGKWYPGTVVAEDELGKVIPNLDRPITRVFLSGKPVATRVYYRKKDGSRIAASLNVSPVLLDGVPVGAIEVFRDISQEIELEKAKDEFISLASHQLRTPATGVKQYIGMILQGFVGKVTSTQKTMLQKAYESNERQLRIISDLLKVAQVDAGKIILSRTKIDVNTLVDDVLQELRGVFEKRKQTVIFEKPPTEVLAYLDRGTIRMLVENVIDNASKYSHEGKTIHIHVEDTTDIVKVVVVDQGVGIKKKDQEKLFEKFSRISNPLSVQVGGTGLGLYWAKKIIDLHRGKITCESKINKGTTFTISLPKELDLNDFGD